MLSLLKSVSAMVSTAIEQWRRQPFKGCERRKEQKKGERWRGGKEGKKKRKKVRNKKSEGREEWAGKKENSTETCKLPKKKKQWTIPRHHTASDCLFTHLNFVEAGAMSTLSTGKRLLEGSRQTKQSPNPPSPYSMSPWDPTERAK